MKHTKKWCSSIVAIPPKETHLHVHIWMYNNSIKEKEEAINLGTESESEEREKLTMSFGNSLVGKDQKQV